MNKPCLCLILILSLLVPISPVAKDYLSWTELPSLPPVSNQSEALGVAGAFVGMHNDALIIAGGANFNKPYWQSEKQWHDQIWVLVRGNNTYRWVDGGHLNRPIAYGASVSTPDGVVCLGGNDADRTYAGVFRLRWQPDRETILKEDLPALPTTCAYTGAAKIGNIVYVAGGTKENSLHTTMANFWMLDLSREKTADFSWQLLPAWPGPARAFNLTVAQHNGDTDCIYVMTGRRVDQNSAIEFLRDVYEFNPVAFKSGSKVSNSWRKRADMPHCRMAGTAFAVGQSHIFVTGGDDGSLLHLAEALKDAHPGFPGQMLLYHTITNTWIDAGKIPANQVTTNPVKWGGDLIIASGEIQPRVRTARIWKITPVRTAKNFGLLNLSGIIIYLVVLLGIGCYFSFRHKNTEDFFRAGQRLPWWAAGCSIFATMLSSLTFMSIPAKTYTTDWVYFLINMAIIAIAPFIIHYILPFFRRIDATSAYEYLERRFNLAARLFASASYILFQVGRMAIVMFLPSLALATVTSLSVQVCILLMGILSILYCTLGGIEAVVWTDTLQTVVLLGGALLSFVLMVVNIDGGLGGFLAAAISDHKFHLINWDWSSTSSTTAALWVVVIGGLAQALVPYSSDQGLVQRYLSVSNEKKAAQAIWTNAVLSFFGSILFFGLGTALYVYFKYFPERLDTTLQNDAIFPQFIASQLPAGIAGIVVAGIFAAAQSTISTSMNSIATAVTTDFVRRFRLLPSEKAYLILARFLTLTFGTIGILVALSFATADIKSMWDSFMKVLGLLGGAMCGLFILGIFSRRANSFGAIFGAGSAIVILALVQQFTAVSFLLYAAIGVISCFVIGYLTSWIVPTRQKALIGLTIFTFNQED